MYSEYEDVAPKYRHIGLEQGIEGITILLGAGFVAAQAMLVRTSAALRRIRDMDAVREAGGAGLPRNKAELFAIGALDRNGVWDIQGINALANYFKHSTEWPHDWGQITGSLERDTADVVSRLGMTSGDPDNMLKGAAALGFGGKTGLSRVAPRVQEWREAIERDMRARLERAGLL